MLPSAEVLEKILRYETALERQLFRVMNPLERMQRRRLGNRTQLIPACWKLPKDYRRPEGCPGWFASCGCSFC
jgi:hypothetical protein